MWKYEIARPNSSSGRMMNVEMQPGKFVYTPAASCHSNAFHLPRFHITTFTHFSL